MCISHYSYNPFICPIIYPDVGSLHFHNNNKKNPLGKYTLQNHKKKKKKIIKNVLLHIIYFQHLLFSLLLTWCKEHGDWIDAFSFKTGITEYLERCSQ